MLRLPSCCFSKTQHEKCRVVHFVRIAHKASNDRQYNVPFAKAGDAEIGSPRSFLSEHFVISAVLDDRDDTSASREIHLADCVHREPRYDRCEHGLI